MPMAQLAPYLYGFCNWLSAVSALIDREARTRFAGGSLGHAWAIVIPVSWIIAITIFFDVMGRPAPIPVAMPVFLATGMVPYLAFRQSVTSMMRAPKAHRHLITMGPVVLEDIFTATAWLELVNAALVSVSVLILVGLWSGLMVPADLATALTGLFLASAIGISVGRFAAVVALFSDSAMRLTPILLRPFFWISGIFFVAAEVPSWALDWLWWNPLLHTVEMIRTGFFAGFESQIATPSVPLTAICGFYLTSRLIESAYAPTSAQGSAP